MGKIVDTEKKYRPRSLADFVFPNKHVEEVAKAYGTGEITRPLILSGTNGTGKSLLSELIPQQIEGFEPQINRVRSCDLNSSKEIYSQFTRNKQFDKLFKPNNQRFSYNIIDKPVHIHDLNATILHTLGVNHERLTYRFQGRDFRLTDIHGNIVRDILKS